jgi:hypothetical protein
VISALALVAAGWLPLATSAVGATAPPADARVRPGLTGAPSTLYNGTYLRGHDLANGPAGAYVVWATSDHRISACRLKDGGGCTAPPTSIDALGDPGDVELTHDAAGRPTAVWMYDTTASVSGPMGAKLATATIGADGVIGPATVVADAPSFGELFSVTQAPDGRPWAVILPRAGATNLLVYPGLTAPYSVPTPYYPGDARLAFTGPLDGVLVIHPYGSVGDPVAAARLAGGAVGSFAPVAGTWSVAGFGLVRSGRGIELVASRNNASYETVVARWAGTRFSRAVRTGQTRCTATGHDLVTDASGRLVDAFNSACGIGVANLANGGASGVVTWAPGNTPHGLPEVATTARGTGWVAWAVEGDGVGFDKLLLAPVALPATPWTRTKSSPAGRIKLTGVQGCMPPSDAKVGLKAKAKKGWRTVSKSLTFDGKRGSKIDGAGLAPGTRHKLKATVVFVKGAQRRTVTTSITVRACPAG